MTSLNSTNAIHLTKAAWKTIAALALYQCLPIFTVCCYFCATNGELVNENISVISEASDHSSRAVHTCVMKKNNEVLDLHAELFTNEIHLFILSDS